MSKNVINVLVFKDPEITSAERYCLIDTPSNLDLVESLRQDAEQAHYRMEVRQGRRRVIYYYDFDRPKSPTVDDLQGIDI